MSPQDSLNSETTRPLSLVAVLLDYRMTFQSSKANARLWKGGDRRMGCGGDAHHRSTAAVIPRAVKWPWMLPLGSSESLKPPLLQLIMSASSETSTQY